MRKLILVTALVLASASAQAGQSRGLAFAQVDDVGISTQAKTAPAPKVVEAPKATEVPKASETLNPIDKSTEAPKFVDRPPAVEPSADQPKSDQKADQGKPVRERRADRSRRHGRWTAGRVISMLHRYGVY